MRHLVLLLSIMALATTAFASDPQVEEDLDWNTPFVGTRAELPSVGSFLTGNGVDTFPLGIGFDPVNQVFWTSGSDMTGSGSSSGPNGIYLYDIKNLKYFIFSKDEPRFT